mgnify:CR=1 FL=1
MSLIFVEIKQENIPTGIPRSLWLYQGGLDPTDQIMVRFIAPYFFRVIREIRG